jgi:hypothetical protein
MRPSNFNYDPYPPERYDALFTYGEDVVDLPVRHDLPAPVTAQRILPFEAIGPSTPVDDDVVDAAQILTQILNNTAAAIQEFEHENFL